MANLFHDLIRHARTAPGRQDLMALARQIQVSAKHHVPDAAAMVEAVALGDASVVGALVAATPQDARPVMSTAGLVAWIGNPLASKQAGGIVSALMAGGADPGTIVRGKPIIHELAEHLGRIEGRERQNQRDGKSAYPTGAGDVLRDGWQQIADAGIDMKEAMRVRNEARNPASTVGQWRERQSKPAVAASRCVAKP